MGQGNFACTPTWELDSWSFAESLVIVERVAQNKLIASRRILTRNAMLQAAIPRCARNHTERRNPIYVANQNALRLSA